MYIDSSVNSSIDRIIAMQEDVKLQQESIKEEVKRIADKLGEKPGTINRIIKLVIKAREKGEVIDEERVIVDAAEKIVG